MTVCEEMPINDKLFCAALTMISIFIIAFVDMVRRPPQLYHNDNGRTIIYVDRNQHLSPYIVNNLITLAKLHKHICSITLMTSDDLAVVSPCGHVFDRNALAQWLVINNTCPICKVNAIC